MKIELLIHVSSLKCSLKNLIHSCQFISCNLWNQFIWWYFIQILNNSLFPYLLRVRYLNRAEIYFQFLWSFLDFYFLNFSKSCNDIINFLKLALNITFVKKWKGHLKKCKYLCLRIFGEAFDLLFVFFLKDSINLFKSSPIFEEFSNSFFIRVWENAFQNINFLV